MATLADLKSQIADDLGDRSDATSQIDAAIRYAVQEYEDTRFWYNEFWRRTATLSVGTQTITFTELGITPLEIDRIALQHTSSNWIELCHANGGELESLRDVPISTIPTAWAIQGDAIVFDCSAASTYLVVLDGIRQISTASANNDASAWFNAGRELIRSAAKKNLYMHVLKDDVQAAACNAAERQALAHLKAKTTNKRATGYVRAQWF